MYTEEPRDTRSMKTFTIQATLVKQTELAWLLDCEGDQHWFPKSMVKFDCIKEELVAPAWILKQTFPKEDWS